MSAEEVTTRSDQPERIEIPAELLPQLGAGVQRYQAALEQARQAEVEIENVRLKVLLEARVDRPELYQIDITMVPPGLRRVGVKGQVPGAGVPAPALPEVGVGTAPQGIAGESPAHEGATNAKEARHGSRKR